MYLNHFFNLIESLNIIIIIIIISLQKHLKLLQVCFIKDLVKQHIVFSMGDLQC